MIVCDAQILIFDHDDSHWDSLKLALSGKYLLRFAKTAEEALGFYSVYSEKINLVLLDSQISDMSIQDLIQQFQSANNKVPPNIVMMTSYEEGWISQLTEVQSFYHVGKPFIKETLLSVLDKAVRNYSLVHHDTQTKVRVALNEVLNRRNKWVLSRTGEGLSAADVTSLVVDFETMHSHPDGLGAWVELLEKDSAESAPIAETPTILLIEDEVEICGMTAEFFESRNQPILVAYSVADARKILDDNPDIDLIFLDLSLPDGSGVSLLTSLFPVMENTERNPIFDCLNQPDVIVTSAYMDKETIAACMNSNAIAYMTKPIVLSAMVDMVNRLYLRRTRLKAIQYLAGIMRSERLT
jgi:DNA-binding NtrC family response regulator